MNILFVDIDGVLTSASETPGSYITHNADEYGPSPSCIKRLIRLCEKTESKVILTSNWRKFDNDQEFRWHGKHFRSPLSKVIDSLGEHCIGTLENTKHLAKADALLNWLDKSKIEDFKFVVFDDDISEEFHTIEKHHVKDNFILTDYKVGLTDEDCEKAIKILNLENN